MVGNMEIIESIAWIAVGFVPTIVSLELISRKYHGMFRSTYAVPRISGVGREVEA
jgi:hypothetical protein